ncbi:Vacuolar protein sorting-associated protein 54 N-terminal [Dioscorea alata]|uniref:Vacuolar protein sorting-associated protein 54 N-terminal n=4 Tax=Dioscorea alata TaxID=55571 RepID=A0ACB7UQV8_DIOAL|nr:Vacuolar protein sorting-associated protein 54 N-terminal [Dioscorea alata]KAH7663047.1 Vacuolar protein sorting-associated protein 54 N-terminal [Dioscorea alata]
MQRDPPREFPNSGSAISDLEIPGAPLLLFSLLFLQGGGMDLSRVGEKILSSVRSARSIGLLPPPPSDRPEVPARAIAAAAVARALAGIPPHQKLALPANSLDSVSIYASGPQGQTTEELEEEFYEEEFDPVKYALENIPSEENDANYFEKKAALRLAQLDRLTERLSRHVMEHHEEMVKGMQLVTELEQDLKVASVICMNGRRHIVSSMNEVSRDLVVNSYSKKKQALLDMLPILGELRHAVDMQVELEALVEKENFFRAFQVLSEYLQVLDSYSQLSAIQEMGRGVEAWLARTLQKLDALLLGVCQEFKEERYITAVDAYALIGDVSGLAEKIQSFFMQEVLSQTHSVLKDIVHEEIANNAQRNRFTYSDLCVQIPESKFRQCLLKTLDVLFRLMCSYHAIMCFHPEKMEDLKKSNDEDNRSYQVHYANEEINDRIREGEFSSCSSQNLEAEPSSEDINPSNDLCDGNMTDNMGSTGLNSQASLYAIDVDTATTSGDSPFNLLRKDATAYVAQTLQRGRKNLWQLTTSRVSVLLSCSAVSSTSTYQFLRNYEDLNVFVLAGEAFCGVEASEFRHRLKIVCENYVAAFHKQNIYALKMVLEKENWVKMPAEALQLINLAGLTGDGAALIAPSVGDSLTRSMLRSKDLSQPVVNARQKDGFSYWLNVESPFSHKVTSNSQESPTAHILLNGSPDASLSDRNIVDFVNHDRTSAKHNQRNQMNGGVSVLEDEDEDLLADFIDEDSQMPSRISKSLHPKNNAAKLNDEEITAQTGSSLCLLRLMDKYARLMQKLEIVNIEFFKGIFQLFGIFYHFVFEAFGQRDINQSGNLSSRLKIAIPKIMQECDQWIRPQHSPTASSSSMNTPFTQMDVMPTIPSSTIYGHAPNTLFGLKERCAAAETISLVACLLHRSRAHLQSMLVQQSTNLVEDFFGLLVDSVPDLVDHIHRTTARMLLHINGYVDKISNAKWEIKELGLEHNGYVDLLLGEYKHYKTMLAHGGISKEVQNVLLEYGLEHVAEILIEGLSRVKKCTDEGRVLMSLDLQVLINGLQHFVPVNVKPKLQMVETFIKAYYLPETEYVHWARAHPEYNRTQIVGLVNLVANMKGWKRKTRLEVLERIESST